MSWYLFFGAHWNELQNILVDDGEDFEKIGEAFELQGKVSREPLENTSIRLMWRTLQWNG